MTSSRKMTCAEAFARLDAYLDRTLSADEQRDLEDHLEACSNCSCEYHYEESFIREVRAKLKRLQAPPELMGKIRAKLGALES